MARSALVRENPFCCIISNLVLIATVFMSLFASPVWLSRVWLTFTDSGHLVHLIIETCQCPLLSEHLLVYSFADYPYCISGF